MGCSLAARTRHTVADVIEACQNDGTQESKAQILAVFCVLLSVSNSEGKARL